MAASAMNGLIRFTAAKEADRRWLGSGGRRSQEERRSSTSGEEAKRFYLSLIEDRGAARESGRAKRRRADSVRANSSGRGRPRPCPPAARAPGNPAASASSERDGHRLLKCAQEGDVRGLRGLLENGCDVNFKDAYYWTAIMCASYAGQRAAVRLLLEKGAAWVGVVDTQGRDARDLADQAGHTEVVRELDSYGVPADTPRTASGVCASPPQWCSVCGTQHSESAGTHQSSTLHQFSLHRPPPAPQYCLPASSASYRMMLRGGWAPGAGLGPEGAGRRNPVGTVLKRDQAGLGFGPASKARVTHFPARDARAVERAPHAERGAPRAERGAPRAERGATLGRRAERRQEARDRNWERDFRTSFNL